MYAEPHGHEADTAIHNERVMGGIMVLIGLGFSQRFSSNGRIHVSSPICAV